MDPTTVIGSVTSALLAPSTCQPHEERDAEGAQRVRPARARDEHTEQEVRRRGDQLIGEGDLRPAAAADAVIRRCRALTPTALAPGSALLVGRAVVNVLPESWSLGVACHWRCRPPSSRPGP